MSLTSRTRALACLLAVTAIALPGNLAAQLRTTEIPATAAQCGDDGVRLVGTDTTLPNASSAPAVSSKAARAFREAVTRLGAPAREHRAESVLRQAEALIREAGERPVQTAVTLHVARSLARLARATDGVVGERAWIRAAELYVDVATRPSSDPHTSTRERAWAEGELASLYLDADRANEALELARRAVSRASDEDDVLGQYRFGRVLALALDASGDRASATEMMRRTARIGESLRRDRLGQSASTDSNGWSDSTSFANDVQATTGRLLSMLLDDVETHGAAASQERLREVRNLLETQRSAELEDHFGDACLMSEGVVALDEITGALVLYPILLDDRVALLTGFEGRFTYYRAPITSEALLDHTRELRRLLEKRTTRQYLRPAGHLYDALIRPIEAQLESSEVNTLVVVPDGLLRTVPFAAFHDRTRGRFLVDLKPVALVPSLRLTRPMPLARESLTVLAAGIEAATGGFDRLDYTRREIRNLKRRFPETKILFDDSFEIDALERALATRPYSIVHVATHGRVAADGRDSFLLAHDGTLGLERMSQLISTTRFRKDHPLELLTLSACETAAGDQDAALGLAGIALRAGAQSALATLWPVNDEATTQLIDSFYEELAKPDQTRAGALRVAQRRVRATPRFEHPGYWAPFLMISNWL